MQLFRIEDLDSTQIKKIIERAYSYIHEAPEKQLLGKSVALIFAEPSTRTRVSFELATTQLGARSVLLDSNSSSATKGEDVLDTIKNLSAMGIGNFVLRTQHTDDLLSLRELKDVRIINAGDGVGEHPSQALLDLLCIYENVGASWGSLIQKKIAIVGNLSHSRVVNSWISLGKLLRLNLCLISPEGWKPNVEHESETIAWTSSLEEGLKNADYVMALRVQKERLDSSSKIDLKTYVDQFQIKETHLENKYLMHPGPVNWGIELDTKLRTHESSLILDQVRCGVHLRAALLAHE